MADEQQDPQQQQQPQDPQALVVQSLKQIQDTIAAAGQQQATPETWGDTLKHLIAPAIIGGLTYLGAPRRQAFATGMGNAINTWLHQEDMRARYGRKGGIAPDKLLRAQIDLLGKTGQLAENVQKDKSRDTRTGILQEEAKIKQKAEDRLTKTAEDMQTHRGVMEGYRKTELAQQLSHQKEEEKLGQAREIREENKDKDEQFTRKLQRQQDEIKLRDLNSTDAGKDAYANYLESIGDHEGALRIRAGFKSTSGTSEEKTRLIKYYNPVKGINDQKEMTKKEINEGNFQPENKALESAVQTFRTARVLTYEAKDALEKYLSKLTPAQQKQALASPIGTGQQALAKLGYATGVPIDPELADVFGKAQGAFSQLLGSSMKATNLRSTKVATWLIEHFFRPGQSLGAMRERYSTLDDIMDGWAIGVGFLDGVKNKDNLKLYETAMKSDESAIKLNEVLSKISGEPPPPPKIGQMYSPTKPLPTE